MVILVTGSRAWPPAKRDVIFHALKRYGRQGDLVRHGGARGADRIADAAAMRLGMQVDRMPVTGEEWERVGKSAGALRNIAMLRKFPEPELVLAFIMLDRSQCRGTLQCVEAARRHRIPVKRFSLEGEVV